MADKNTILVVDDDPEIRAYYWRIFEEDTGAKFDVLGDGQTRRHSLLCHRLDDSFKFLKMFEDMHQAGPATRFPLCIIDLKMLGEDGLLDELRGCAVAQRVREVDSSIHIVIATSKADIDGEDLCRKVGGSTHFFQTPFSLEQEEKFVLKVHELVDEWNERN
jgi:CheY-like chemotaxis protein